MALEILMPKIGMTTTDMILQEWLVAQGDEVEEGQAVAVVETDKTTVEVEAVGDGCIDIRLQAGGVASTGEVIAVIHGSADAVDGGALINDSALTATTSLPAEGQASHIMAAFPSTSRLQAPPVRHFLNRCEATPAARRLAADRGVDLTLVTPTGPEGRVIKADVERALARLSSGPLARDSSAVPAAYAARPEQIAGLTAAETHRLAGVYGAIAASMMNSLHGMAQLSTGGQWNADGWVALRQKLLAREKELGCRISYTAMMVYALAKALRKHPYMNASIVGDEIRVWKEVNVGVAVSAGVAHLSVPVIRDADQKSLPELAKELDVVSTKVRNGSISPQELNGSTFTLTSLVRGVNSWGTPVINAPNAAILLTSPIRDAAVVRDGKIVVGKVLPVSLTYDHRLINGLGAAEFCLTLSSYVESPELLIGS